MSGVVASIYRHPVKGFTPERLNTALLTPGKGLAFDRVFAVEDGPSGFDPAAPEHISKQKFTVLAKIAEVALVRTRFDDATGVFHATAPGLEPIAADLTNEGERARFAAWLSDALRDHIRGPLRVLPAPGAHRFFDHPQGAVSLINLESVRDLGAKIGMELDPLRFRANFYVDGWPAWHELSAVKAKVRLGDALLDVFKPIVRCAATHVDPATGARDVDLVAALYQHYGHMFCGLYLHVETGADVPEGAGAEFLA